jgi:hypothetical protein
MSVPSLTRESPASCWRHSPDEIAALIALVIAINAWSAIGVSTRAWVPGSYQP